MLVEVCQLLERHGAISESKAKQLRTQWKQLSQQTDANNMNQLPTSSDAIFLLLITLFWSALVSSCHATQQQQQRTLRSTSSSCDQRCKDNGWPGRNSLGNYLTCTLRVLVTILVETRAASPVKNQAKAPVDVDLERVAASFRRREQTANATLHKRSKDWLFRHKLFIHPSIHVTV